MSIEFTIQAITNTVPTYLNQAIDLTLRKRFVLSYLKKAGRILTNTAGPSITWNVTYKQPDVRSTNGNRASFSMANTKKQLSLGFAQLESTNAIDRNTLMVNSSPNQIVNLAEEMTRECVAAITDTISDQIYYDNTNDPASLAGFKTLLNGDAGAATDLCAVPAAGSTYGGLSMVLGAFGGNWSAELPTPLCSSLTNDWPEGSGSAQYDFMAPKFFNYNGDWTGGGVNNWRSTCEMIMRRAAVSINALGGEGAAPSIHLLPTGMYTTFQDSCQDRERLQPSDYAKSMGFPDMMTYAGALLAYDYSCPAATGYAFNPAEMALCSMAKDLLYTDGPTWSIVEQAYLFLVGFTGNIRFNPKYIATYGAFS